MKSISLHWNFIKVKEEILFLCHSKLQILSYHSRTFLKFFWAINCCSYKTHGFQKKFAFRENIFALRILRTYISLHLFSRNFAKKFAKCDRTLHWTVGRRYFYMGWCFIVKCFSSFHFSHYHEDFNSQLKFT